MNKLFTVVLGAALFSSQAGAVTVLGEDFAAYTNGVAGFGGFSFTDTGNITSGPVWSGFNDTDTINAITDTSADTFIVGASTGAYVDLTFDTSIYNGTGDDLKLFFVGNNGHFFDVTLFNGATSLGSMSYSMPNPQGDTGFTNSAYPTDGIFALSIDFDTDFGGVGNNAVSMLRLTIGDGYTANSAVPSFIGGYHTTAPVPVPAAVWLFGSGLLGLAGVARRRTQA